jgi:hypothetical protein
MMRSIFKLALNNRVPLANTALDRLEKDHQAAQSKLENAPIKEHTRTKLKKQLRAEYERRKDLIMQDLAPASPE